MSSAGARKRSEDRVGIAVRIAGAAMLAGAVGMVAWLFLAPASAPRTVVLPTPRFTVTVLDGPGIMRGTAALS